MRNLRNTSLGLWVDLPKRMVLTEDFFNWFAIELGFDSMSIMIDGPNRAVNFSWGPKDVERALRLAEPCAIEVGLTTWPYPDSNQLAAMKTAMDELLSVGPVAEWETDEEFNWRKAHVAGFVDLNEAGVALGKMKQELCTKYECRNSMTTFTFHLENGPRATTAPDMDRVIIQAYAIDERDGKPIGFDHRFGPGNMQKITLDRTMTIKGIADGSPELGVGHAAWAQHGFTVTKNNKQVRVPAAQAMLISFETSLAYKPVIHNWWSAKFVYPKSRHYNTYSELFLKSLRAK